MKIIFLAIIAIRLFFAINIGLTYDEAYYWSWSKNLSLNYYDHPAMVAWMIKSSTIIFGDTVLGVRFWPLILSILASYAIYILAKKAINESAALWAALALQATLLIGVAGFMMTPDLPLLLFWILALLALFKFLETGEGRWWIAIGASIGLAFISKYSAIFLGIGVAIIALKYLKNIWVYIGAVTALVLASPAIIWNFQNGWISFMKQGTRTIITNFNPFYFLELIAGQGLLLTPIIGILFIFGLFKIQKNKYMHALILTSIPLAAFLIWQSLFSKIEGNWPAPLLPSVIIIASLASNNKILYKVAAPLGLSLSILILSFIWLKPIKLPPNLTDQLYGGKQVAAILKDIPHDGIYTVHYTTNAWLRFYMNNIEKVQQIGESERYLHEKKYVYNNPLLVVTERNEPMIAILGLKTEKITTINQYGNVSLTVFRLIK